jgi:hypothetical protein
VKFLRLATNALAGGLFFSVLLALLVIDLNINLAFSLATWLSLTLVLMLTYGILVALVVLAVASIYRFFAEKRVPVPFLCPSFLTLAFSLLTFGFLVVYRENYFYFISFFVPGTRALLRTQMLALFLLAIAGLVIHYRHHHLPHGKLDFAFFFGMTAAVLALAAVQRISYPSPPRAFKLANVDAKTIEKRVTILCLEGLSLEILLPYANERKLPNFSWLMKEGSWGRLDGFTPSDPHVLTATFNTGKLPGKHRQISDVKYRVPGMAAELEVVPRFILFRQMKRLGLLTILPNDAKPASKDIWQILAESKAPAVRMDGPFIAPGVARPPNPRTDKLFRSIYQDLQYEGSWIFTQAKQAFFRDAESEEQAFQAKTDLQPQVFSLLLDGAVTAEMYFYKYSFPAEFGDIRQDEIVKFGGVIEKYCQFYDQIISKYLASLREGELFIVYSPHGAEPLPFWKRVVEWALGNSEVSAYHEQAPAGVAFFYGKGIVRGKAFDGIRLVDMAPTILYYIGLPVGKDMDGIVKGSLFEKPFTDDNPVLTITSYEDANIKKSR